jgi:RimJ/RimL family protein N-acetyltransferase
VALRALAVSIKLFWIPSSFRRELGSTSSEHSCSACAHEGASEVTEEAPSESALSFATERLHIRPVTEADESLYCALYTDSETMRFIARPLSPECAASSFQAALRMTGRRPLRQLYLALIDRQTQRGAGICSLQGIDPMLRRAEAGLVVAPDFRGGGFGGEAVRALLTIGFTALSLDEIWAQTPGNHGRAERLLISEGFTPSGGGKAEQEPGQRLLSAFRTSWPGPSAEVRRQDFRQFGEVASAALST